ncbi:uncharacterized protein LOC135195830 isoform X2 [Macrobrachium nipponense]|uniref:uncharacterized protein LOC135195830 isoform X2 n=1 Tax=Macrobrachium nipponense TaxID=159736 RepID=UPI0030C8558D
MAPSPLRTRLFLLVVGLSWHRIQCECVNKASDQSLGKQVLPDGKVLWWCTDPTQFLNATNRVHVSSCSDKDEIDSSQICGPATTPGTGDCATANWTKPVDSVSASTGLPSYVKYYTCSAGKSWISGMSGRFTQCINGEWTHIFDYCFEDCYVTRDCSMVAKMGFNESGYYDVTPSGIFEEEPITVWCNLSSNHNYNGWTIILKYGLDAVGGPLTSEGGGDPGPTDPKENYFIGIEALSDLSHQVRRNDTRRLVFTFQLFTKTNETFHATNGYVLVRRGPTYTLNVDWNNYHGQPGNAFVYSRNENYSTDDQFWWNTTSGAGFNITSTELSWGTLSGDKKNLSFVVVAARPWEFDKELSCPPVIAYYESWSWLMQADLPFERTEGSNVTYECTRPMYMEGRADTPKENKTYNGTSTCVKNSSGVFDWSFRPRFPCTITCPFHLNYTLGKGQHQCFKFYNDTVEYGITTASLKCSKDEAWLARIVYGEDMNYVVEGKNYYTAYINMGGTFTPKPPTDSPFSCEANHNCTGSTQNQCLTFRRDSSTSIVKSVQNCSDNQTYFGCSLPAYCASSFTSYKGHCYLVVTHTSYRSALARCATLNSALAYPESIDVLHYIKGLVWLKATNSPNVSTPMVRDRKVLIGLNNLKDGWGTRFGYEPDPEIIALSGESTGNKWYRYLTVPRDWNDNVTLTATDFTVDSSVTIDYAVCQMHGPNGCWEDPPPATENMYREWNGNTTVGSVAIYRCYPGFFMNNSNVIRMQTIECRGQLGGWVAPEYEIFNCTLQEACTLETVPCLNTTTAQLNVSQNFLTLNSSIQYICPPSLAMPNGTTNVTSTCVETLVGMMTTYTFKPALIPNCSVCLGEPIIFNATTNWSSSLQYSTGATVDVICNPGFLVNETDEITNYSVIECTDLGWLIDLSCLPGCVDPLPVAGSNMSMENVTNLFINATVIYSCDEGSYIPAILPEIRNHTVVTCGVDGKWNTSLNAAEFYCAEICLSDPVLNNSGAIASWNNVSRTIGSQVNITCSVGYALPQFNKSTLVTCEEGGHWTNSSSVSCRRYTLEEPPAPNGTVHNNPSGPHWEGTALNFSCPDDLISMTGQNMTSITFNGTNWVPLDPEFACFNVCHNLAPEAPENVRMTTYGIPKFGAVISYDCQGKYPDGSSQINITCDSGNWSLEAIPECFQR